MKIVITTDSDNIVKSVHQVLNENESYQGKMIETFLDINTVYLVDNYRLVDAVLVELTEEEKQIDSPEPTLDDLVVDANETRTRLDTVENVILDLLLKG